MSVILNPNGDDEGSQPSSGFIVKFFLKKRQYTRRPHHHYTINPTEKKYFSALLIKRFKLSLLWGRYFQSHYRVYFQKEKVFPLLNTPVDTDNDFHDQHFGGQLFEK